MKKATLTIDDTLKSDQPDDISEELIEFVLSKFSPARSMQDATLMMTTAEILSELQQFYPGMSGAAQLHEALKEAGFTYDVVEGMKVKWMLKAK